MNELKLSLIRKWELDCEFSFLYGSVLLPDGTAIILTKSQKDWKNYCVLILSSEGVRTLSIAYVQVSNRDYPVLFQYGQGFGIIVSAKEVQYYTGDFSLPEIIPIKNKSLFRHDIIPENAEQRYFQNISDTQVIAVCFENEIYYGDARYFALLEFDAVAKRAKWKSFNKIDKKAFAHSDDHKSDDTPKIDSLKISGKEIYAFIPGESSTSVNKWGMDYYALVRISEDGKIVEKLIESGNLKQESKKRGINGRFTNSQYVIMSPVFKNDDWKGKQKVFSLRTLDYSDIAFPKGMSKHKLENITNEFYLTFLYDRGIKEIALCRKSEIL